MLAVSLVSTLTASLLAEPDEEQDMPQDGNEPWLVDVLTDARHDDPVGPSRVV